MADNYGKRQGATVAPRVPESQGWLVVTKAPDNARGMIGAALTDIGGTGLVDIEGDYECEIITEGWATVSAHVRVSAEVGAVVPTLITRWFDATTRDTTGAVALAANTLQTLTLTNLNGQRRALLAFTIASGESLTFDRAEFNGQ